MLQSLPLSETSTYSIRVCWFTFLEPTTTTYCSSTIPSDLTLNMSVCLSRFTIVVLVWSQIFLLSFHSFLDLTYILVVGGSVGQMLCYFYSLFYYHRQSKFYASTSKMSCFCPRVIILELCLWVQKYSNDNSNSYRNRHLHGESIVKGIVYCSRQKVSTPNFSLTH